MGSCALPKFDKQDIVDMYTQDDNAKIVEAAAVLVDNGRAGTLSRFQEIIAFAREMNYKKIGFAYCYGMEVKAAQISNIFISEGFLVSAVSCTVGGIAQDEINSSSCIHNVSCNPIGQSTQINAENVDFVVTMGLCLGHDILFQKYIHAPATVLAVKDRVHNHAPLEEFETNNKKLKELH